MATISAPGMTAPDGSVTKPVKDELDCAHAEAIETAANNRAGSVLKQVFIGYPFLKKPCIGAGQKPEITRTIAQNQLSRITKLRGECPDRGQGSADPERH
jgi:hypothetical protein